jgi:hypothetical protein
VSKILVCFLAIAISGCSAPVEPLERQSPTSTTTEFSAQKAVSAATSPGDLASASWTGLAFEGAGCDAESTSFELTNGPDATFLLGLGADVAPVDRERLGCDLRGEVVVPAGYYPTSFTYTVEFGAVKPAGGSFRLESDVELHVRRGAEEIDVTEPISVTYDEAIADDTFTRDVTRSQRHFCGDHGHRGVQDDAHVRFDNRLQLDVRALRAEVAVGVDAVDVEVAIAPCPSGG